MSSKRVEDFGDLLTSGELFIINQIGVIKSEMVDNNYSQRGKHLTDYPLILGNEGSPTNCLDPIRIEYVPMLNFLSKLIEKKFDILFPERDYFN